MSESTRTQDAPARRLVSTLRMDIRWSDMDANRHVNNAKYFTYMEQARIEWLERHGLQDTPEREGGVIVRTGCTFMRPISAPCTLLVQVYAGGAGRTSFPTWYALVDAADPSLMYAEGDAIMVWTDRVSGGKRPIPDQLRRLVAVD